MCVCVRACCGDVQVQCECGADNQLWRCVREKTSNDRHGVADSELDHRVGVRADDGHDRVVQAEVETTVHEDTDERDVESTVQTNNAVSLERLLVHVNQTRVLALGRTLT